MAWARSVPNSTVIQLHKPQHGEISIPVVQHPRSRSLPILYASLQNAFPACKPCGLWRRCMHASLKHLPVSARRSRMRASLRESTTVRNSVNSRGRKITGDARTIDIVVSGREARINDEVLLSAFARGFFNGSVFGLERLALRMTRPGLFGFPGSSDETTR